MSPVAISVRVLTPLGSEPIKNFPPAPVQFIFDREKNEFTVIQNKS
jgi:hypothetical protein